MQFGVTPTGGYLGVFSQICCWRGLSWQRLSIVDGGVLGGGVRGVNDDGPLGATAVFAAAGLVPLTASIAAVKEERRRKKGT